MSAAVKLRAWLELVRAPNLLTVPGDPLAGACLVLTQGHQIRPAPALAAGATALSLYMAGLIFNDCFDLQEDRQQRPNRPLPSGRVKPQHAAGAAVVLLLLGLLIAASVNGATGLTAAMLLGMILLYNRVLKHVPAAGPLAMGLCRGLSVLLGAAAVSGALLPGLRPGAAAGVLALYVAAVTLLAERECEPMVLGPRRWLPTAAMALLPLGLAIATDGWGRLALLPAVVALIATAHVGRALREKPEPAVVQHAIGRYLRLLLLVQAACCLVQWPIGAPYAAALLLFWPLSGIAGRRFYAS